MPTPDSTTPSHAANSEISWRLLSIVNLVRLLVGGTLLFIFEYMGKDSIWGQVHPVQFRGAVIVLLAVSVLMSSSILQRKPKLTLLAFAGSLIDSTLFGVLMYSSGGFDNGLGVMLLLSVGSAAVILPRQLALFTAAFAVMALLGQEILLDFDSPQKLADYTGAGLLGVILFLTSIGVQRLGERYHETEALAKRRGVDIANLSQLNDYVVQRMRESIVVLDENGQTRLMNQSAARLLGAHNPKSKYNLADLSPRLHAIWQETLDNPFQRSEQVITMGDYNNLIPNFVPLGSSPSDGTLLFLEDNSMIQEKIQQSKLAALGRLSASIAHEIRNPLSAIRTSNQLLGESKNLDAEDLYFTEMINKQVKRVNQIIENVLGLTRAPLDKPDQVDLHAWLEHFIPEFIASAQLSSDQIRLELLDDPYHNEAMTHSVPFGETQLRQVITNLFENALAHASTDKSSIKVVCRTGIHALSGRFVLEVCDNGDGIDESKLDELFEPFNSGSATGSGLGLYIARELCSLNHSTLLAENQPNGGACFRILFADTERWIKAG
jgi:two-component system sensor histidine kinase PilS (NtrC family)